MKMPGLQNIFRDKARTLTIGLEVLQPAIAAVGHDQNGFFDTLVHIKPGGQMV